MFGSLFSHEIMLRKKEGCHIAPDPRLVGFNTSQSAKATTSVNNDEIKWVILKTFLNNFTVPMAVT
jgi:hypothetical protein